MKSKIELLAPAGSLANLKAAVVKGADAVYFGMNRFNAREYATNFNKDYLTDAVKICRSNDVKSYLVMNILVKNNEIKDFFNQLSYAYSKGIDAVIIQETSFIPIIRKDFPDLKVHISTQAGVMNSYHVNSLSNADRINLARELSFEEIKNIRKNFKKELEVFCHGALCVSVSGQCLFSSFLGGRSGNRGRCAQPCRKKYNDSFFLSTKELCLINRIPDLINAKIDSIKIEGRMRTPFYVATATEVYRKAIDSFYDNDFKVSSEMIKKLESAFTREFTEGCFAKSDIFNRNKSTGIISNIHKENYEPKIKNNLHIDRKLVNPDVPRFSDKKADGKNLLIKVYNMQDAVAADQNGADIIYYDIFKGDFAELQEKIPSLYAAIPRLIYDEDFEKIRELIKKYNPKGLLIGNYGMIGFLKENKINIPIHLDYNLNIFNDIDLNSMPENAFPIISPELSINELKYLKDKNFAVFVHGKIPLMNLRHKLPECIITDERNEKFIVKKIHNGTEILNRKELGILSKTSQLKNIGITNFFIDTDKDIVEIVKFYRNVLDGKKTDDSKIKSKYVLGWYFRGVQ